MKEYLLESIKIVNRHFIYVIILSITGLYLFGHSKLVTTSMFLNMLLSLILYPAIYGRLIGIVLEGEKKPFKEILFTHWFNYVSVAFILGAPTFIFLFFFKFLMSRLAGEILLVFISGGLGLIGIYAYPCVFLFRKNISSIFTGFKYLLDHFTYSVPLIILTALIFIIKGTIKIYLPILYSYFGLKNPLIFAVSIGLIQNVILGYITLIVFVTASFVMIRQFPLINDMNQDEVI